MPQHEPSEPGGSAAASADIRHLVCGNAARLGRQPSYGEARTRVLTETAAGERSRVVLMTERSHRALELALDVQLDILPVFGDAAPGGIAHINRPVLELLFSSARPGTIFFIYETGHPILGLIKRAMRERGIVFRRGTAESGAAT